MGALAEKEGWKSVVLVTSTYHATRAGMLLRRCHDGDVDVVAAKPRMAVLRSLLYAEREFAAVLRSALDRGC